MLKKVTVELPVLSIVYFNVDERNHPFFPSRSFTTQDFAYGMPS